MLTPVHGIASEFIRDLTGSTSSRLLFKFIPDHDKKNKKGTFRYGTLDELWSFIVEKQKDGFGIHISINHMDGKGATRDNVTGLRALFVDKDDGNFKKGEVKLTPNLIVKSKKGQHLYWFLVDGEPIDRFSEAQKRLALTLKTDPQLTTPDRSLRLAGTVHQKDPENPVLLKYKKLSNTWHTIDQILDGIGAVELPKPKQLPTMTHSSLTETDINVIKENYRRWLQKRPPAVEGQGGDLYTLQTAMRGGDFGLSEGDVYDCLLDWNGSNQPPWSERELQQKVRSAFRSRTKEVGSDPPRRRVETVNRSRIVQPTRVETPEKLTTSLDEIKKKIIDADLDYVAEYLEANPKQESDLIAYARDVGKLRNLQAAIKSLKAKRKQENQSAIASSSEMIDKFRVPQGYRLDDQGTFILIATEEGIKEVQISSDQIIIDSIFTASETSETWVNIKWKSYKATHWKSKAVSNVEISDTSKVHKLATYGIEITSHVSKPLVSYFQAFKQCNFDTLNRIVVVDRMGDHGPLGWMFGNTRIGGNCQNVELWPDLKNPGPMSLSVGVKGVPSEQFEVIKELESYPRALMCLYASCASPFLSYLGCSGFVVDISGKTTRGKTSALRVAASVWGSPRLIQKWNTTATYRERWAAVMGHLPIFLDDHKDKGFSWRQGDEHPIVAAIYQLADGIGRGRGTIDGFRETKSWHLVAFSTGESSILDYDQSEGSIVRTLSFSKAPFPDEANEVMKKLPALEDNYGWVGFAILNHLATRPNLKEKYLDLVSYYKEIISVSNIANNIGTRTAQRYAAIHVAAETVHSILDLGFKFDETGFLSTVRESIGKIRDADRTDDLTDGLWIWCVSKRNQFFGHRDYDEKRCTTTLGIWYDPQDIDQTVFLTVSAFRSACRELGVQPSVLVRDLFEKKLLCVDNPHRIDRYGYAVQRRIDGAKVSVYGLKSGKFSIADPILEPDQDPLFSF